MTSTNSRGDLNVSSMCPKRVLNDLNDDLNDLNDDLNDLN